MNIKGCVVVFDTDYKDERAEVIMNALLMIKGVLKIEPVEMMPDEYFLREQAKSEIINEMRGVVFSDRRKSK